MKIHASDILVCSWLSIDDKWISRMNYYAQPKNMEMSKKIVDMYLTEVRLLYKHRKLRGENDRQEN